MPAKSKVTLRNGSRSFVSPAGELIQAIFDTVFESFQAIRLHASPNPSPSVFSATSVLSAFALAFCFSPCLCASVVNIHAR